jgi:hypothetical protein
MPNPAPDHGAAGTEYTVAIDTLGDKNPKPQTVKKPPRKRKGPATRSPATHTDAGQYTAATFAEAVLRGLGAPVTPQNVKAMVAWEAAEGGHWNNTAWYNPLNTTLHAPGATSMNGVGVKAYTSWKQGIQATISTLKQGNMSAIREALMQGNNAGAVAHAVVNSPWGTHTINLDANNSGYGTVTRDPGNQGVYGGGLNPTDSSQLSKSDFIQGLDASGFPKALINSIPELKKIFDQAIEGKWWQSSTGQERFLTAIKSTHWWKKTTDNQRRIEALKVTDPSEYQRELTKQLADVRAQATQLGVPLSAAELNAVAQRALTFGLDNNELSKIFAAHIKYKSGQAYQGQLGMDVNSIQQLASSYYVKLGDGTVQNLLRNLTTGQMSPESLTDYFKQLSESKFPHLKKQLDSGQTVADVADPYKQEIGQILEQDPNGIKNDDPLVMKALQQPTDKGDFQLMPIWQFQTMLKQDPRWLKTTNARNSLMDLGTGLLKSFGLTV